MCGIIGMLGEENVVPHLLEGLKKLEYRGYDSAGIAVVSGEGFSRVRTPGKLANLEAQLYLHPISANVGIGHTRWATHGGPSTANAHPHYSPDGRFSVVHNGIIENAEELKRDLLPGAVFASETDTEVVSHLLQKYYEEDPVRAIVQTLSVLRGSFALGILCTDFPDTIFAAAYGSPLVAAKGENGLFIASDTGAVENAREVYQLRDCEIAVLRGEELRFYDHTGAPIEKTPEKLVADALVMDKGDYEHYMLFEIMQQPAAIRDTLLPLLRGDALDLTAAGVDEAFLKDGMREVVVVACGSAYHTGLAAERLFEGFARVPCRAAVASEFRYADPVIGPGTLTVFVSQSGETADTLAALRLAKEKGARVLSIVNVPGSAIASESDCVIYTRAGREIAVATTKAYSAQLAVFYALAIRTARLRGVIGEEEARRLTHELTLLPEKIAGLLPAAEQAAKELAVRIYKKTDMFFIGRQLDFAAATEASLKMKEISYLNSQAYAAGELKHGTISLVEQGTPVVSIAADPLTTEKTRSNMSEVKARGAFTVAVTTRSLAPRFAEADALIELPDVERLFACSLSVVPMQLLAYYTAKLRGCDIDKPKNLAKSVTVE